MQPLFMFKLDQRPDNCGLRCDEAGLFLGRQPLLTRDTEGNFEELPPRELRQTFRNIYGEEMESESRIRSVRLVADALNKGDMARATMVAVLMRLPDPDESIRTSDDDGVLAKAGFNPDEPRDERGRWTTGGGSDVAEQDDHTRYPVGIQIADAGMSDASNDAVAEAARRATALAHEPRRPHDAATANSWITHAQNLWAAIVAFFGKPQNTTHTVEDAHELASKILGEHLSKMPGVRAIYYHRALSTITNGQIRSGRLPDVTVVMDDNTVKPYEILSPKQEYSDVAKKYARLRPVAGSQYRLAEPEIKSIDEVMALPEAAPIAAEEAEAQAAIAAQEEAEEEAFTLGNP